MHPTVYIGPQAQDPLVAFCAEEGFPRLFLLADTQTYAVLGATVEGALQSAGYDVRTVVLPGLPTEWPTCHDNHTEWPTCHGKYVVADAHHIQQVLIAHDGQSRTFVVVGTGTLTDIGRFVSHRMNVPFIALPTAPSVDGFASRGAPLVVDGVKITFVAHAPRAIFADLDTLASAPKEMIAAGFGDMLGKYTSVADWRLGALLWDEPYDEQIAERTLAAVDACVARVEEIGAATRDGVGVLMRALIDSGICMLDFGDSRPASGSEHHMSHFWEMKLLKEQRPAILHGAKVGAASILMARLYAELRSWGERPLGAEALAQAEQTNNYNVERELQTIRAAYGEAAEEIIAIQQRFLAWDDESRTRFLSRVESSWDKIQSIARTVPEPAHLCHLLQTVGAPTSIDALGLSQDELHAAHEAGHYLRDRLTVRKLMHLLGRDELPATL